MTTVLLVVVLLTLAAVLVLAVVVAAMLRSLTKLRAEVERAPAPSGAFDALSGGLAVGSPAPPIEATALDGSAYTGDRWNGALRLVTFAHPGCPPCEDLVPGLIGESEEGSLPPAIVVSRGDPAEQPPEWRRPASRADLVTEHGDDVARRFESFVTPHVFVVTPQDRIGARGVATTVQEVRDLVARATGDVP
jgi:hypothetical protein